MAPKLTDMSTWTGRTGHDGLRSFTDEHGNFWLEQNPSKTSKWAKFAKKGHNVAWEFGADRRYTGRMLIGGEIDPNTCGRDRIATLSRRCRRVN